MKKFINRPETMAAESLEGFVAMHDGLLAFGPGKAFVRRRQLAERKVALISGGGAGHEPLHTGFIGLGMLDAACTGHIFTSPTPDQIVAAIEDTDTGSGCLLIVKNYDGDVMNFEMASEMAVERSKGRHRLETLLIGDDVSGGSARSSGRRGVAGTLIVEKILGAAAENGASLAELMALGEGLAPLIRSMGVALTGAIIPATSRPTFVLSANEMEVGVGIHGEPGRAREAFRDADAIIDMLCSMVAGDLAGRKPGPCLLFINGFGSTPPAELWLAYRLARQWLEARGFAVVRSLAGNYVTSLDTHGLSVTLAELDEPLVALWDQAVSTPVLRW